ncbi:solute carrier family 35 member G2-like [Branchiostoma floridae]|uniref:Solute carrier family 35 member G2-like n=1 Tax=Branchiostoma floridae TaxID=7739 RepID=A0A9J7LBY1_BRAFL|nr:solute carrier family 35 member G2-like [Branchiostoma floridae]
MQHLRSILKSGLGVLLAMMVASGAALTSILMRLTKRGGVQNFQSIFWNQVAQMIFVLCLTIAVRPKLRRESWKETAVLVSGGIIRVVATVCLCLSYLHVLPGNTSSVVYGLGPVLTIGLAALITKERPTVVHIIGMVICICGVTMVGVSMNAKETNNQTVQQQVVTLLYPISASALLTLGLCWVLLRWLSKRGVPLVTHMFYYSIDGILLLPLAYVVEKPKWSFPPDTWGLLVAQTLAYAMQYLCNAAAIHNETAATVQIVKVLTVPSVFVLGFFVLEMVPNVLEICGGAIVTVGAMVVGLWTWRLNLKQQRRELEVGTGTEKSGPGSVQVVKIRCKSGSEPGPDSVCENV